MDILEMCETLARETQAEGDQFMAEKKYSDAEASYSEALSDMTEQVRGETFSMYMSYSTGKCILPVFFIYTKVAPRVWHNDDGASRDTLCDTHNTARTPRL